MIHLIKIKGKNKIFRKKNNRFLIVQELQRRIRQNQKTPDLEKFEEANFTQYNNIFKEMLLNNIKKTVDYTQQRKIFKNIQILMFQEKYGIRTKENAKTLTLIPQIFQIKKNFSLFKINNFQELQSFFNISSKKNFFLKREFLNKLFFFKLKITFLLIPYKWNNYKGLIANSNAGKLLNPYSKTPAQYKNKNFKKSKITQLKELEYYILCNEKYNEIPISHTKLQTWKTQTKNLNIKTLQFSTLCVRKKFYGYIVGTLGIPVILYRTELNLSSKQMQKNKRTKNLKKGHIIYSSIFDITSSEKRINLFLQNLLKKKINYKTIKQMNLIENISI